MDTSIEPDQTPTDATAETPKQSGLLVGLLVSAMATFLLVLNVLSLAASQSWQWDLLTHFRFQYLVAFVVMSPALALLKWKKMAALSLVGLVFNAWFVVPMYLPNAQTRRATELRIDATTPALKVLHYNVNTANARHADVASLIRNSGADIVFLQEINRAWVAGLERNVGDYQPAMLDPRTDNFGIGMWVRSDSGIEVVSVELRDISDGLAQVNAIDAVVRLGRDDGPVIRLLSLHTLPPVSGGYAIARDAQLAGAAQIADSTDGPFVLIGDLNATQWSVHFRSLVEQGGLIDSMHGRGRQASWPAGLFSLGMIPIDHALTRGGAAVVERRLGDATGSDHRPLFVEIRLVPEPTP